MAGLLGLPTLAWLFLLTPAGLRLAALAAERAIAAGSGLGVRIEGVSGTLPVSLAVSRFALSDQDGPWLIVADARFSWSPLALLRGRVLVHELSADVVRIRRPPKLPPRPETPMTVEWPPRFPSLPPILVDRLAVSRLILDKELAGQDAVIDISGRLAESGQGAVALALEATRRDGDKPLALRLGGALNYADWRLSAKASLSDAPGGLLSAALSGPDGGALVVSLLGDGPLAGWKGRLSATLGDAPLARVDLGLAVPLEKNAMAAVSLDAVATPPPGLLSEDAARLLGDAPSCRLAGRIGIVSGALTLDSLEAHTAAGSLTASAALSPETDAATATVRLNTPDASRLASGLGGALAADIDASGPLAKPRLALHLSAHDFRAGPLTLADGDVTGTAEPSGPLNGVFPGAALRLRGVLNGFAGPEGTTLLGDALTLEADGGVDAAGDFTAKRVSVTGRGGTLHLTDARYAGSKSTGHLRLEMADVAGAASLIGLRLSGGVSIAGDASADNDGRGDATLDIRFARLTGDASDKASAALAALAGPNPALAATGTFSPAGVALSRLLLDGKAVNLSGSGRFDADAGTLIADAAVKVADAGILAPALGVACGGSFNLNAALSGPAASPRLTVKGTAERPVYDALALAGADLDFAVADLAGKATGTLRLNARREGETARLETGFSLDERQLGIKDLRVNAPEANFSGDAAVETTTGRVTGKLSGNAASLTPLGRFAGLALAGGLKFSATATAGKGGQRVALDLNASGLRLPGLTAASLAVAADLDDVTGNPRGRATANGKGLALGGFSLAALEASAAGDGRSLTLALDAKGRIPGDHALDLSARGSLATADRSNRRLTVQTLAGALDARKFSLTAPAALTFGSTTRLDGLALAFDKARFSASGSLGPNEASGKIAAERFPLPALAAFGLAGLDGTATVSATISGSPAKPAVTAEARLDDLRLASERADGLPALALWSKATVSGGRLSVTAGLGGKGKKDALSVTAGLPLRLSLAPFVLDAPSGGSLSGHVTADSDLSDLGTLLARINTRLAGRLTADMTLGGTLAAPNVSGGLALAASRLENADAGLVLRNITVRAEAGSGLLTIDKASGEDTKGGRFSISGKIGIADPENGPVDLSVQLVRLRVAGLDLATVAADGKVVVTGTLSHMRAAGKLVIGPADINLPTSLPPDVAVIPVILLNDPKAPKTSAKVAPPAAARHIDLDLEVALGQAVYVRGLGLESRWGGHAAVTGTAAAPVINGKYFVEKGLIELFGSHLDITKGELIFRGESPPAPTFDIQAQNTSGDVTAGVSITGDAANPVIALTSTPVLPHDEILARILFGQSASTLSPLQAAQLAQAAASLYSGGTPTSILARTRRILGLDQLTLVSGKGGVTSTVLRAGKEIVKGVTVGVEQGMGAQSSAVSVEVQVTPNITIDSRVGANNKQGVGVNWKWDY